MQCYEYPLQLVANGSPEHSRLSTSAIIEAHMLLDALRADEYFAEGPALSNSRPSAGEFFQRFEGPSYQERLREFDPEVEARKLPKAYDVALTTAPSALPEAKRLLRDLLKQGIAHDPVGECLWFFGDFDEQLDAFDRLAKIEGKRTEHRLYDDLLHSDE